MDWHDATDLTPASPALALPSLAAVAAARALVRPGKRITLVAQCS